MAGLERETNKDREEKRRREKREDENEVEGNR